MCKILISLIFSVISCNPCDVSCVNSMNYQGRTKDGYIKMQKNRTKVW